jgi:hypothetical protein
MSCVPHACRLTIPCSTKYLSYFHDLKNEPLPYLFNSLIVDVGVSPFGIFPFLISCVLHPQSHLHRNALYILLFTPPYITHFPFAITSNHHFLVSFISPSTFVSTMSLLKWWRFCKPCNKLKNIDIQTDNFETRDAMINH